MLYRAVRQPECVSDDARSVCRRTPAILGPLSCQAGLSGGSAAGCCCRSAEQCGHMADNPAFSPFGLLVPQRARRFTTISPSSPMGRDQTKTTGQPMYVIRWQQGKEATWLISSNPEQWGAQDRAIRYDTRGDARRIAASIGVTGDWSITAASPLQVTTPAWAALPI